MEVSAGDVIAAFALLLSAYATWRSHKFKKKEEDLLDVQRKVNALILEKEEREAAQANRADLGANFFSLGSSNHRLKVFNKGKAIAHGVEIDFPEGNDVLIESDIRDKFPMETMEPGQAVELIAAVRMGTKRKQVIRLTWKDTDGKEQEKIVHATL